MKKTEPDKMLQADPELDTELARMAEDVPPMPADFHEKWMNAIRAEAGKAVPAPAEESAGRAGTIMRWTRALSIAAVFVLAYCKRGFLCRRLMDVHSTQHHHRYKHR